MDGCLPGSDEPDEPDRSNEPELPDEEEHPDLTTHPDDLDDGDADGLSSDDLALYDRLSDDNFADHAFEVLSVVLVAYASPRLRGWMMSGALYRKCEELGRPVYPGDVERDVLRRCPDEIAELLNETLGEALVFFRNRAVRGEYKWDPAAGSSLTSYFMGACALVFPTVFRRWSREIRRQPPTESYSTDDSAVVELASDVDIEQQIISEIVTRKRLNDMPPNVRRIVELRLTGQKFTDIARAVDVPSARAVEGILKRYRDQLRRLAAGGTS